jgi:hypothetical protein
LKQKSFGDERKGMRKIVVKQTRRIIVKGKMGKKWKELRGVTICYHLFVCTSYNYEFTINGKVSLFQFCY